MFPVKINDNNFIENIAMLEGTQTFSLKTGLFGHCLYVKSIIVTAVSKKRTSFFYEPNDPDTPFLKVKKNNDLIINDELIFDSDFPKIVISIDITNPNFDLVELNTPLNKIFPSNHYAYQKSDEPVSINIGTMLNSQFLSRDYSSATLKLMPGSSVIIPVNALLKFGEGLLLQRSTTELKNDVSFMTHSYLISNDLNFDADVIYIHGDSVANLSSYVDKFDGHFYNVAKLHLNDNYYNYRCVSKSHAGKTSTFTIDLLKQGLNVIPNANILIFAHGINDAYQNTTDSKWHENLTYFIKWRDRNYPDTKLLFLGATQVSNTQTEQNNRLNQLRAIQSSYADDSKKIYYFSLATVVLPTYEPNSTCFTDEVHPTPLSHRLYGEALGGYLTTILN